MLSHHQSLGGATDPNALVQDGSYYRGVMLGIHGLLGKGGGAVGVAPGIGPRRQASRQPGMFFRSPKGGRVLLTEPGKWTTTNTAAGKSGGRPLTTSLTASILPADPLITTMSRPTAIRAPKLKSQATALPKQEQTF